MKKIVFIIMGVSGCGKSSLAKELQKKMGGKYYDGDDFHSSENIAKMSAGIALRDDDRYEWLQTLKNLAKTSYQDSQYTYIACSALKSSYRMILKEADVPMKFLFLYGEEEVLAERLAKRAIEENHFMSPNLLKSQLAILEAPTISEDVIILDIRQTVAELVLKVKKVIK